MKKLILEYWPALILVAVLAVLISVNERRRRSILPPTMTIKWQCDWMRAEIKSQRDQETRANEFNRTNTDHTRFMAIKVSSIFGWSPKKGDTELGYRSDGVVVWRVLPEGESK